MFFVSDFGSLVMTDYDGYQSVFVGHKADNSVRMSMTFREYRRAAVLLCRLDALTMIDNLT